MASSSHSHWISIADLMSGFLVIILVLFSYLICRQRFDHEQRQGGRFKKMSATLRTSPGAAAIAIRQAERIIEFPDAQFESGQACLNEDFENAIDQVTAELARQLEDDPTLTIQIEGHADTTPVCGDRGGCRAPVKTCGGWFADNMQLSTLRAWNIRERIASHVKKATLARLPVTGWGAERLRDPEHPKDAVNRRVELHPVWAP